MKKLCTAFVAAALIVGCQSGTTTPAKSKTTPPPTTPEKKMDGDNAGKADTAKPDEKADDKKGG